MAEARRFRAIRGVRDILPPETSLWNWFEETARRVMESYGFREIRLPVLEDTALFARSVGADTDIVSKEMYTFERRLEILRQGITDLIPALDNEARIVKFVQNLVVFVNNFESGIQRGEIEGTASNLAALEKLGEIAEEAAGLWKCGKTHPDAHWDLLLQEAKSLAGVVALGQSETLRPEATASVVRAYIEHGMHTLPGNVKLYYVGPMFRRERPQKGRYRQFYQIGAEVLGSSDHPAIDAEVIEMLTVLLERCRIGRWTLLLNSIGCTNCRPKYITRLREALLKVKDKLGPDSQRRIETNPLRVLDSKLAEEQRVIETLPRILDDLCEECRGHFAKAQEELKLRGIPYEINWRLVRGLDYYTRTTFEITSPVLGAQNALVGGGRYDGLSELLGGPPAKGIGFALGEDRFIDVIKDAGKVDAARPVDVFLAWIGAAVYPTAVKLARRLRAEDFTVEMPPEEMKLKKSLGLADKLGARHALLVGEDEVASGSYILRRLADGEQKKLSESELVAFLRAEGRGSAKAAG